MKNLLQVALIGGAAYLAIDYLKKRKANQKATSTAIASTSKNLVNAEMQEEGEEGLAIASAKEQQRIGVSKLKEQPLNWNSVNGWNDSTVVSNGI
jgi:hypothetical protein